MELSKGDQVSPKEGTYPMYRCGQVGTVKEVRDSGKPGLDVIVVHFNRSGNKPAGTVSYSRHDLMLQGKISELFQ